MFAGAFLYPFMTNFDKNRTFILIDGSNFYFKMKALGFNHLLNFDFGKFAQLLIRSGVNVGCKYYVGKVRQDGSEKSIKLLSNQQKLFENLKSHGFRYVLGYLLKSDGVFHEKGVDVQIAVDMMELAYEDKCDRIVLVSSDTDLGPAIRKVQARGKVVEYVGFSNMASVAMVSFCKESRLLTKEDINHLITDS